MSTHIETDLLLHIMAASRKLAQAVEHNSSQRLPSPLSSPSSNIHDSITALALPAPESPMSYLSAMGLDSDTAAQISQKFLESAKQLKAAFEAQYRACRLYGQDDPSGRFDFPRLRKMRKSAHMARYTRMLQTWMENIVGKLEYRVLRDSQTAGPDVNLSEPMSRFNKRKSHFTRSQKQAFTPNRDTRCRQVMIPRYRTWLQKRRRRDKSVLFAVELENSLEATLSADAYKSKSVGLEHANLDAPYPSFARNTILLPGAPPHAYPALYPPICSYDPFPIEACNRQFPSPWIRKSTPCHPGSSSVDMAQLTDMFAKMALIGEGHNHRECDMHDGVPPNRVSDTPQAPLADFVESSTVSSSAPLPALLPIADVGSVPPACVVGAYLAPNISPGNACDSTVLQLTPPTSDQAVVARRGQKVVGLPKRVPATMSTYYRHLSPALSDVSTASSSASLLSLGSLSTSPISPLLAPPVTSSSNYACHVSSHPPVSSLAPVSSTPEGRMVSQPQRVISDAAVPQMPDSIQFSHTPYSRTSSRSPSLSSLSSGSSLGSSSETESPLPTPPSTPPSLATPLPSAKGPTFAPTFDPCLDVGFWDNLPPVDGLQLDVSFGDAVRQLEEKQYSLNSISLSSLTGIGTHTLISS